MSITLLSLASKQIWPHVLAVMHLRPARVFLLHTDHPAESRGPAQRLKRLFEKSGLLPQGAASLAAMSHSDFTAIENRLDALQAEASLNLRDCVLNFTGGNKLMATAAFRWAARRGVKSFYLERGNQITSFEPRDGDIITSTARLDGHVADNLDPVAVLRCQLDASEVERPGQALRLTQAGQQKDLGELSRLHLNGSSLKHFLAIEGEADPDEREGYMLEFNAAAILLKLGVPVVQRSLRLKVKSAPQISTRKPHAEIDLLFNYGGKLWLVDCKDRKSSDDLLDGLERELQSLKVNSEARKLLIRIRKELSISQTKVLKEDLIAVHEAGGLQGQIVCVRKSQLPEEVIQYARHNGIEIVAKAELAPGLQTLLQPDRKPDAGDLQRLAEAFRRS
jgi:hypothetical protein